MSVHLLNYPEQLGRPIVCDMTLPQSPAGSLEAPDFDSIMTERARCGVTFTSITIASDELSVGETVRDIQALISAADGFGGPGILVPTRDAALFRWCLENGLRVKYPMTLMSVGMYQEPVGSFLPSVLF